MYGESSESRATYEREQRRDAPVFLLLLVIEDTFLYTLKILLYILCIACIFLNEQDNLLLIHYAALSSETIQKL